MNKIEEIITFKPPVEINTGVEYVLLPRKTLNTLISQGYEKVRYCGKRPQVSKGIRMTKRQRIWYWLGYHGLFQISWWWRKNYYKILGIKNEPIYESVKE